MRRLGILALAVAATCALPLAGCLDIKDKDGMINTQPPIETGKDAKDESSSEAHPIDGGEGPSSSMQQQIEDADEDAKGGDAASAWLETDDEFPIDLEADENIHVRAECKDTDGYGDAVVLFTVWNNTGADMMIGDTDGYAYVNGRPRDVYMRQTVEAGGETRAYLTFLGTFDDPDFDVNNDLNDICLNIWMFEEETGNVYFRRLIHIP